MNGSSVEGLVFGFPSKVLFVAPTNADQLVCIDNTLERRETNHERWPTTRTLHLSGYRGSGCTYRVWRWRRSRRLNVAQRNRLYAFSEQQGG
jgi:hypothetical protein